MNASSTFVGVEYVGGLISPANSKYAAEYADFCHPNFSRYQRISLSCAANVSGNIFVALNAANTSVIPSGGQKYRVRTHQVILPLY